jgi:hypothetical protein
MESGHITRAIIGERVCPKTSPIKGTAGADGRKQDPIILSGQIDQPAWGASVAVALAILIWSKAWFEIAVQQD